MRNLIRFGMTLKRMFVQYNIRKPLLFLHGLLNSEFAIHADDVVTDASACTKDNFSQIDNNSVLCLTTKY